MAEGSRQDHGSGSKRVCHPPKLGLARCPNLSPKCCMRKHDKDGVAQRITPHALHSFLFPLERPAEASPVPGAELLVYQVSNSATIASLWSLPQKTLKGRGHCADD